MKKSLLILTLGFFSLGNVFSQQGNLDLSFNEVGYVNFDGGRENQDRAYAVGVQSNGKIVVSGISNRRVDSYDTDAVVVRFNTDGSLDENFGDKGVYAFERVYPYDVTNFYDMTVLPGGGIVAAGAHSYWHFFSETDSIRRRDFLVVKLKSDGTPDESFGNSGVVLQRLGDRRVGHLGYAVITDDNGNIYVGGSAELNEGNVATENVIMKLLPTGELDSSFGSSIEGFYAWSEGENNSNEIHDLAIAADGGIIAAGDSHVFGEGYVPFMAKINSGGTGKDASFGSFGSIIPFATGYFDSVIVLNNGNIYGCGYEEDGNGEAAMVYAYDNRGKVITTFANNGRLIVSPNDVNRSESIIETSRGKLMICGSSGTAGINGTLKVLTVMFDTNGDLDPTWGDEGIKIEDTVHPSAPVNVGADIRQDADGNYVLAVASFFGSNANDITVMRYGGFGNFEFISYPATCSSNSDGIIEVTNAEGQAPIQYSLNGVVYQDLPVFAGLSPGTYSVYVKDGQNNINSIDWAVVESPSPLTATYNAQGDQLVILANGGTPPYMYSIDGINFQSSASFSGWNGDDSNILVKDANNCRSDATVGIAEAQMAQAIQLYPNPVSDILNINAGQAKLSSFTLTDVSGRIILNENLRPSAIQQIDLSNLDFGVYTLVLRGDFGSATRQILKK